MLSIKDLFKTSVYWNKDLSECQKLQHLKSADKNRAHKTIQFLPIFDSNFDSNFEF